ncbi:uncharacterized protein BO72DRAFT_21421 [Aspergillus fijiensis CBS 313.89]|uniref:Uncharacterized protein n=1 Tax=Aspergillus fijiensis CBS 313.89 TaxID=1448319 RepID=A0A8G1VTN5_9EURO|nr:uncharacterized protein BO72DRAFT_21421 [Aspergillus fijiensis CBS 313.89]RAK71238.1 hypothetical protein BO72DRAFT_21421 [Aspergillus fijiensis CBS 313.89]
MGEWKGLNNVIIYFIMESLQPCALPAAFFLGTVQASNKQKHDAQPRPDNVVETVSKNQSTSIMEYAANLSNPREFLLCRLQPRNLIGFKAPTLRKKHGHVKENNMEG